MPDDKPAVVPATPDDGPLVLQYSTFRTNERHRFGPEEIYDRCLSWLTNGLCALGFVELSLPLWKSDAEWPWAVGITWIVLTVAAVPAAILHLRPRRPTAVRTLRWLNLLLMLIWPVGTGLGIYYFRHFSRRGNAPAADTVEVLPGSDR